jgi:hypothetical protein
MNSTAKILVPNKEWLIKTNNIKIGSISKSKKGYVFLKQGKAVSFKNLSEINAQFGVALFEESIKKHKAESTTKTYLIYDFPCGSRPYDPVYNIKQKLPLYAKSSKSKSLFCAGYYVIKFHKGWRKAFCPKLITLERYPYKGPFKTEDEMKSQLTKVNKNETIEHNTD